MTIDRTSHPAWLEARGWRKICVSSPDNAGFLRSMCFFTDPVTGLHHQADVAVLIQREREAGVREVMES